MSNSIERKLNRHKLKKAQGNNKISKVWNYYQKQKRISKYKNT